MLKQKEQIILSLKEENEMLKSLLIKKSPENTQNNTNNSHNTNVIVNNNPQYIQNIYMQVPAFSVDFLKSQVKKLEINEYAEKAILKKVVNFVANATQYEEGQRNLICTDVNRIMLFLFDGEKWIADNNGSEVTAISFQFLLDHIGDTNKFIEDEVSRYKKKMLALERKHIPEGPIPEVLKQEVRQQAAAYQTKLTKMIIKMQKCADGDTDNKLHRSYHKRLAPKIRGDGTQRKAVKALHRNDVRKKK